MVSMEVATPKQALYMVGGVLRQHLCWHTNNRIYKRIDEIIWYTISYVPMRHIDYQVKQI